MKKTYTFHIKGMHCKACVFLTETELLEIPGVSSAKSSLSTNTVELVGEFGDKSPELIAEELSSTLQKHGYSLSVEKSKINNNTEKKWSDFKTAVPIAMAFIILFFLLQKL